MVRSVVLLALVLSALCVVVDPDAGKHRARDEKAAGKRKALAAGGISLLTKNKSGSIAAMPIVATLILDVS